MAGELAKRVAVAAVGIPFILTFIYLGGWFLGALLAVIAALGALEFFRIARKKEIEAFDEVGAVAAALIVLGAQTWGVEDAPARLWNFTIALVLFLGALSIWRRGVERKPLASVAVTVAGALFLGGTLAYAVWLREIPEHSGAVTLPTLDLSIAWRGTALVLFPLVITWINDSMAYFVGRAIGKRKLIPRVSPGKTVEGAIAGVAGGVAVSIAWGALLIGPALGLAVSPLVWALAGAVIAVVAQIGDLVESLLKREAGVKDSGALLPGHGGVLDRFDALFFAIPVAYGLLRWMGLQ
jgi:phosphatidate cytidylyltransferase